MRSKAIVLAATLIAAAATAAGSDDASPAHQPYRVQPGDVLTVSVWKEDSLQGDVLVRPDGGLSFPLVGDVSASGKSTQDLTKEFIERLKRYIPDPVVTIQIKTIGGNRIYVVGKVTRPGEYPFSNPVDVTQALALAGGATEYAALNDIVILRRDNGVLKAMRFRYADVEHGRDLSQDVLLQSGDTVVVP
jgi:polysaccharide biosynthesis/export protein